MPVYLSVHGGPYKDIARREILRRTRAMLRSLQLSNAELSLVLTDDAQLHELNKLYRAKDRPTDVLAFAMREGEFGDVRSTILGDIVVSVPTAKRQALARECTVMAELTMLIAHGLLHLLGWDHDTPAKDRTMRRRTNALCKVAGVAKTLKCAR